MKKQDTPLTPTDNTVIPKPVKERDNLDLLELVCQLHSRALNQPNNKLMHDAYVEARNELESRIADNTVKELTVEQWCKLHTGYYGEEIDTPEQLVQTRLTGRELFEYCQHIVKHFKPLK